MVNVRKFRIRIHDRSRFPEIVEITFLDINIGYSFIDVKVCLLVFKANKSHYKFKITVIMHLTCEYSAIAL